MKENILIRFVQYSLLLTTICLIPIKGISFPDKPALEKFVVDQANFMGTEAEASINEISQSLLRQVKIPIFVVTITSLAKYDANSYSVEEFARNLFNHWGIGYKDHNYGILLLISKEDREARIELGAEWGRAHDQKMQKIMDKVIIPKFKENDFENGILKGVIALQNFANIKLAYLAKPNQGNFISQPLVKEPINDVGIKHINNLGQSLQRDTNVSLYVALINSLYEQGAYNKNISAYTRETFQNWNLDGNKSQKNILFLISVRDRKAHIEISKKWTLNEDIIKDEIMDDFVMSELLKGEYTFALKNGLNAIEANIRGRKMPVLERSPTRKPFFLIGLLGALFFSFVTLDLCLRGKKSFFYTRTTSWYTKTMDSVNKSCSGKGGTGGGSSGGGGASGSW